MRYSPLGPVVVERGSPPFTAVAVIFAPVTTAPWESVTTPAIVPRVVCAKLSADNNKSAITSVNSLPLLLLITFLQTAKCLTHSKALMQPNGWDRSSGGRV